MTGRVGSMRIRCQAETVAPGEFLHLQNGPKGAVETEILKALRDISRRLEALPAAIAAATRKQGTALRADDRRVLALLLPRINVEIGDAQFTIRDALAEPAILWAIEEVTGTVDGKTSRALGRLFARADGFAVEGFRIDRIGEVRDGALWRVSAGI